MQSPSAITEAAEDNIIWLKNAYAWLYHRLDSEQQNDLSPPQSQTPVGPPSHFVPVLAAGNNGVLGFLEVDTTLKYGQQIAHFPLIPPLKACYLGAILQEGVEPLPQ